MQQARKQPINRSVSAVLSSFGASGPLTFWRIASNALISSLALLLLVYAGYGETLLTVKKLRQEQASAQAGLVRSSIEAALHSGLPLSDISGLDRLIQSTLSVDSGITAVKVVDKTGFSLYPYSTESTLLDMAAMGAMETMEEDASIISFQLPLEGRLETEGYLRVELSKETIDNAVSQIFAPLFVVALVLVILALPIGWLLARSPVPRFWREQGWFTFSFSVMSLGLVLVLMGLYIQSASHQVRQVNDSLLTRLAAADSHGIPLSMLSGISGLLQEYLALNPELHSITLSRNGVITHSAGVAQAGETLTSDFYQLTDSAVLVNSHLRLTTSMGFSEVVLKVVRAGKNFTALYLTTLLLSLLFNRLVRQPPARTARRLGVSAERNLEILRPLFFIAVFMEALSTAIMPELLNTVATEVGLGTGLTSILFMLYFLSFALILLPGNGLCRHWGNHRILLAGFSMAVCSALLLAAAVSTNGEGQTTLALIIVARIMAGIGQGLLMVAVQNEILACTTNANRTSGTSIIVTSFNGGFICGAALGALLASYMGSSGVFMVSAVSGMAGLLIVWGLLDTSSTVAVQPEKSAGHLRDYFKLIRHRGFIATMACIGLPAKATLTGIVTFSLPLILSSMAFASEDIGQIIIVYAVAVLLSTRLLSSWVDKQSSTHTVLSISMAGSGVAVLMIAMSLGYLESNSPLAIATMMAGIFLLGLAHGGINAPVVSHVSQAVDGSIASVQTTVTFYRFLERFGHVLGPLLAGQVLILAGSGPQALLWMAFGLVSLAFVFMLLLRSGRPYE